MGKGGGNSTCRGQVGMDAGGAAGAEQRVVTHFETEAARIVVDALDVRSRMRMKEARSRGYQDGGELLSQLTSSTPRYLGGSLERQYAITDKLARIYVENQRWLAKYDGLAISKTIFEEPTETLPPELETEYHNRKQERNAAFHYILMHNQRFALSLLNKKKAIQAALKDHNIEELGDYMNEAAEELGYALNAYDPKRGKFITFASQMMDRGTTRLFKGQGAHSKQGFRGSDPDQEARNKVSGLRSKLANDLGRDPTAEEILAEGQRQSAADPKKGNIDMKTVETGMRLLNSHGQSMNRQVRGADGEGAEFGELLGATRREFDPEDMAYNTELRDSIETAMDEMNADAREAAQVWLGYSTGEILNKENGEPAKSKISDFLGWKPGRTAKALQEAQSTIVAVLEERGISRDNTMSIR